jgi:hypothetical protein
LDTNFFRRMQHCDEGYKRKQVREGARRRCEEERLCSWMYKYKYV